MFATTLLMAMCCGAANESEVAAQFPATTRLIVGFDVKMLRESAMLKPHAERLTAVFSDWNTAFANLGLEFSQIERVWIGLGDGYPNGTVILISGKFDPAKVDGKMQQHIRERRFAVSPQPGEGRFCYSMEMPIGLNPVPGLPSTLFVGLRDQSVVLTFDRASLATMIKPLAADKSAIERMTSAKDVLEKPAFMVTACFPVEALTANGALLAGVSKMVGDVNLDQTATAKLEFHVQEPLTFLARLNDGLEQSRQLFAPLATQQGLDPKSIQLILDLLATATAEAKDDRVVLTVVLKPADLAKALKK